jgi:hypothetical protein
VIEVKEILRLWLDGRSLREVSKLSGADRKTLRRYVETARSSCPAGGVGALGSPPRIIVAAQVDTGWLVDSHRDEYLSSFSGE